MEGHSHTLLSRLASTIYICVHYELLYSRKVLLRHLGEVQHSCDASLVSEHALYGTSESMVIRTCRMRLMAPSSVTSLEGVLNEMQKRNGASPLENFGITSTSLCLLTGGHSHV
jgi:hypothetical protein